MAITESFLDAVSLAASRSAGPLTISWPTSGNPGSLILFETYRDWQRFVPRIALSDVIPQIVTDKFDRAKKLYLLAWIDMDLIKAGELVSLTALELALQDRYGDKLEKKGKGLNGLLQYMVQKDGWTDELIPMCATSGGTAVQNLYETESARKERRGTTAAPPMTLAAIRNGLAHGAPFNSLPWGGLLELVRDLIAYAYRRQIEQLEAHVKSR